MKICLLHCKINFDNMEPYGILQLGTILERMGHEVLVCDVFPEDQSVFLHYVLDFQPDLIGFSVETPAYSRVRQVNEFLQAKCPRALRCAGGVHPTAMPEQTLRELSLDFLAYGEAEISFPQAISKIAASGDWQAVAGLCFLNESGRFVQNPPAAIVKDLDDLPIINRRLIPYYPFYFSAPGNIRGMFNDRSTQMMTTRGCPFDCTFCSSNVIFGKRIRRRSVDHVIKEIEYLQGNFGIRAVYFVDDTFTVQPSWVARFCERLLEKGIALTWCCQSRADTLAPKLLGLMKRAGCVQIDMGIESGSPRVLKALRKGETADMLAAAVHTIKAAGLRVLCSFVLGAPEETPEDLELTLEFVRRTQPTMSQYFTLSPYPGSELYEQAHREGRLTTGRFDDSWSLKSSALSPMQTNLTAEELMAWRARLENLSSLRDHREYLLGWFRYPHYIPLMVGALCRYIDPIRRALFSAIKKKRAQLLIMEIYKRFNQYLLMRTVRKARSA